MAERCGFGTATALRVHFRRLVGTTPMAYRRTFGQTAEIIDIREGGAEGTREEGERDDGDELSAV